MKILVVDDNELMTETLTAVLEQQNYVVEVATDGQAGLALATSYDYDLLLLDVMLPRLDGISLCRQLRLLNYTGPILLLTGRDSIHDKAIGLDAGADDYLVKPFDPEELRARIRALLRRAGLIRHPQLTWGQLQLDPNNCEVTYAAQLLSLTPKEYALLELFLRNNRRVFSCGSILDHLWAYDDTPGEEAVRTHIKGLRHKLKAAGAPADLLETVYGIGYRLKPESLKAAISRPGKVIEPDRLPQHQTLTLVAGLWERFHEPVMAQLDQLEAVCSTLNQHRLSPEQYKAALQTAHSLAGSLGTFGFEAGSQLAHQLERELQLTADRSTQELAPLLHLVSQLRATIDRPLTPVAVPPPGQPLLLIVDHDLTLAEALVKEAEHWGFQAAIALTLSAAREHLYSHHPNVVLLDLEFSQPTAGLTLLAELQHRKPPVPVVVFTTDNSLTRRLEVLRQGGQVFLQKPVPTVQVLEKVNQVLQQTNPAEARILVVDDDPLILTLLKTLLDPWGLRVTPLQDPRNFWETLEACSPDLLILDVEMPHLNGIELCQVVRNDARWNSLPILFLTAHDAPDMVNQVFAAGADDFVHKPIIGPELVNRILNRLERIKLLRQMAETDPLTLVANRHKSTQDLEEFLRLAKRHWQPLCLAVLDIDHFKQVNDSYGHAVGDAVLRHLGHLLRQSFRQEDVVARWGGEEFIIGLYGVVRADSVERLTTLLKNLRQHKFSAGEHHFQVTFSAGVAEFPQDGTDIQALYRAADAALYQAKQNGRDQVL